MSSRCPERDLRGTAADGKVWRLPSTSSTDADRHCYIEPNPCRDGTGFHSGIRRTSRKLDAPATAPMPCLWDRNRDYSVASSPRHHPRPERSASVDTCGFVLTNWPKKKRTVLDGSGDEGRVGRRLDAHGGYVGQHAKGDSGPRVIRVVDQHASDWRSDCQRWHVRWPLASSPSLPQSWRRSSPS